MVSLEFHIALPLFAKNRQNPVIAEKLAWYGRTRLSGMRKFACIRRKFAPNWHSGDRPRTPFRTIRRNSFR